MGTRWMANVHASLDSTWKSRFFQISTRYWGVYSTTFDAELRNEVTNFPILGGTFNNLWSYTLINTFKKFTNCYNLLSCQLQLVLLPRMLRCINIKLFLPVLMPRNIWNYSQNLIAVHTRQCWKQEWDVTIVIPTMHCNVTPDVTFGGYIPQLLILNSEMKLQIFPIPGGVHSTTFHLELRNERFTLISFMGFPAIFST